MKRSLLRVTVHIDGGARGNPGPAGAGVVIASSDDGTVLHEGGYYLGRATNNVAEYRALIAALEAATALGASEIDVFSDSELLVRQMLGQYRVKNEGLKPLFECAGILAGKFDRFGIQHIRRERNQHADRLVNQAINAKRNVEDAAT